MVGGQQKCRDPYTPLLAWACVQGGAGSAGGEVSLPDLSSHPFKGTQYTLDSLN